MHRCICRRWDNGHEEEEEEEEEESFGECYSPMTSEIVESLTRLLPRDLACFLLLSCFYQG